MPHYKDKENNLHFLDSTEFEHVLPAECIQITDKEAEDISVSKIIPPTYSELRAMSYPSYSEQFDTIFHDGIDVWKEQIQAIKNEYPKDPQSIVEEPVKTIVEELIKPIIEESVKPALVVSNMKM